MFLANSPCTIFTLFASHHWLAVICSRTPSSFVIGRPFWSRLLALASLITPQSGPCLPKHRNFLKDSGPCRSGAKVPMGFPWFSTWHGPAIASVVLNWNGSTFRGFPSGWMSLNVGRHGICDHIWSHLHIYWIISWCSIIQSHGKTPSLSKFGVYSLINRHFCLSTQHLNRSNRYLCSQVLKPLSLLVLPF